MSWEDYALCEGTAHHEKDLARKWVKGRGRTMAFSGVQMTILILLLPMSTDAYKGTY